MNAVKLTRAEVDFSRSIDRGALALRMYRQCKKDGLIQDGEPPSNEAIQKLNAVLNKFGKE